MSAAQKESEKEQARAELDEVLAYHGGDALKALATLLGQRRNLREELAVVEQTMSVGYVRGCKPKYE